MPKRFRDVARRGVTLLEMIVALTLFTAVFALSVPFFRAQARTLGADAGRLDAQQAARYAQTTIDRDLRLAGAGVLSNQPMIVQADKFALTFNADIVTRDPNDPSAAYYDPDVDSLNTVALQEAQQITLPLSSTIYPQANFTTGGVPGPAETISYWLSPDTSSGASDQYVLYRRVNNGSPSVVVSGIVWNNGDPPPFTYYKIGDGDSLVAIPASDLPLYHAAAQHGLASDTGMNSWVDSIRMVTVRVASVFNDPAKGPVTRVVQTSTQLLNAGMQHSTTCGQAPIAPTGFTAVYDPGPPADVTLTWNESLDQDAGEKDVERYMVFRRLSSDPDWGDAITSVAASSATYSIQDVGTPSGTWVYGLAAQDCSPANSSIVTAAAVTVP